MPNKIHHRTCVSIAIAGLAASLLAACGGGDGPAELPAAATTLSGVAAAGAPLAGATITVSDSDAATADPSPVTAGSDGSYTIVVTGLKAPLLLKATSTQDGETAATLALVPSLAANAANTANITPLTHAVAALVAPGGDTAAFATPAVLAESAKPERVANASALVVNTLRTDDAIRLELAASFDPLTTAFKADGSGVDGVLDKLLVTAAAGSVSITNLAAPLSDDAVPASVTLTPAQVATPTVVPTLPQSTASDAPTPAELAALGAKFEACLALPVAQRVALDAQGVVTSVLAPCDYAPAGWRSNGRNWAAEVGQFTLAKSFYNGAKVGKGQVVLTLAPDKLDDPKAFKHPYCNAGPCVVVRYPVTTASGQQATSEWTLGKVDGAWNFVGNQRPYRVFVEPRMSRKVNVNRDGAAAGNTGDPYYFKDRVESVLRLTFDLSVGNTQNVRAVRFSGPGLPAGGVVQLRSARCGTHDRMAIADQTGATASALGVPFNRTNGASTEFVLDAANLDGSRLTMPVSVELSPVAVAAQAQAIPAWSRYKVEIFGLANPSTVPDEVVYVRNGSAAESATAGTAKPWPTLSATYIADHLRPDGAQAGSMASPAGRTIGWTSPAGSYVTSAYLFSQNFATLTNAQNETASYGLRTRLDYEVAAFGDTSASGFELAGVASGISLSPATQDLGIAPNPRCTSNALVPLTSHTSDYREAGLTFRGHDRKIYNAIWFWDN